jgi:hypothetical protein
MVLKYMGFPVERNVQDYDLHLNKKNIRDIQPTLRGPELKKILNG